MHRAPGPLSGGCAAAPRRAAHKAAPRVPPPPPPPARPGAALELAVPRRSSRRGGRRGASVRWAGRHCRSLSGRGRAVSEKAPPGACARVSAQDPGGPPARTSSWPGPWVRTRTRTPLAAARVRPAMHPGADASRTHGGSRERCESTREQGARLAPFPSSASRASASLGPEAAARGEDSAAMRLAPRPAPRSASGRIGPKRLAIEEPGWREAILVPSAL